MLTTPDKAERRWSYPPTGGVIAARAAPGSIGTLCRRQRLADNLAEIGKPRKRICHCRRDETHKLIAPQMFLFLRSYSCSYDFALRSC
jgi:hypothetical protein